MKKTLGQKEYFIIGIVIFLFTLMSFLSFTSINQLRGNARVVNYTGIVRGATQRLVKQELHGSPNDVLIQRLDSIINELTTGKGSNDLIVLQDKIYLHNMEQIEKSWEELKNEIYAVRDGQDSARLYQMSESYFELADLTVSCAELYSEKQVSHSVQWLIGISLFFVLLIIIVCLNFFRASALRRKADVLGKLAYLDALTQIPNRTSCEQEIQSLTAEKPEGNLAVFMFDMNNLKKVNDVLGHQGGDRIITDFARILKNHAAGYGFIGRYGGDEFIALFRNSNDAAAIEFLTAIDEKVTAYNLLHPGTVVNISYAVGYVIGSLKNQSLEEMIDEADKRMYIRKRQMKELI